MIQEPEREAEEQLRDVVQELRAVHYRLLGIAASLQPEPEEPEPAGVRARVECVLIDRIRPAIQDLSAAADDLQEPPEASGGEP